MCGDMQMRLSPAALVKRADGPETAIAVGSLGGPALGEGESNLLTPIRTREREGLAGGCGRRERAGVA